MKILNILTGTAYIIHATMVTGVFFAAAPYRASELLWLPRYLELLEGLTANNT